MEEPVDELVRALRDLDEGVAELLDRLRVALNVVRHLVLGEVDLVLEQLLHDDVHVGLVERLSAQLPSLHVQLLLHLLHLLLGHPGQPTNLLSLGPDHLPQPLDSLLEPRHPWVSPDCFAAGVGVSASLSRRKVSLLITISFSFIARTHPQNLRQETSGRLPGIPNYPREANEVMEKAVANET